MSKSYDEMIGATGRTIFFRPERARVRDFLSPQAQPRLRVGGAEFPVFDLSMNGLSFLAPRGTAVLEPGVETDLTLLLHGRAIYEGRARVARVERGETGMRVGLALTQGFLDLPALARQDEEDRLERELTMGADPYRDRVPEEYRRALERAVFFVQFNREALRRHEARYKAQGGVGGRQAITALEQRALAALREPWTEIRLACCRAADSVMQSSALRYAAKQLTETTLTPLLLDCPCVRRSYEKPLGYPGDYQVMIYCYNHALEGDSVFARVFHKLWLEHPMPSGVRTRRDLVVDLAVAQHERLLASGGGPMELRLTSVGCGPAREVPAFVDRRKDWPGSITWTLIDQDEEALSVAYQTAQPAMARSGSAGMVRCLNISFTQLVQEPTLLPVSEGQHLIASSGLFDYLREAAAQDLLAVLYDRLAPGGMVAVGNAIGPNEDYWSPEFVLDWSLLYRSRSDMLRLAERLPSEARVEVVIEPGGAYYYLLVTRPERSS